MTPAVDNTRAILAVLGGVAAFTIGDTFIKLAGGELPLGQMIAIRGAIATSIMLAIAGYIGVLSAAPLLANRLVALRLIGEIGASLFFFSALLRMPFADTNAVLQFVPLALTAASAIFLAEKVGWRRWLATLAGLAGVLLIVRPGSLDHGYGPLFALLSVASITLRDIATRKIGAQIPTVLLATATTCAVMLAGCVMGLFEEWRSPSVLTMQMLVGAASMVICGSTLFIFAMRNGELSAIAPFRYSVVVFAIVAGYVVWQEVPDSSTLAGTAIVVAAGLYTFHRERRLAAAAKHPFEQDRTPP